MFFVRKVSTGEIVRLETPEKVTTFMLGRVAAHYEIYYGASALEWPTGEGFYSSGLRRFLENIVRENGERGL